MSDLSENEDEAIDISDLLADSELTDMDIIDWELASEIYDHKPMWEKDFSKIVRKKFDKISFYHNTLQKVFLAFKQRNKVPSFEINGMLITIQYNNLLLLILC